MPCKTMTDESGNAIGFICGYSLMICHACGKRADILCDICDKPLCKDCAVHIDDDTDMCETHNNKFDKSRAVRRRNKLRERDSKRSNKNYQLK